MPSHRYILHAPSGFLLGLFENQITAKCFDDDDFEYSGYIWNIDLDIKVWCMVGACLVKSGIQMTNFLIAPRKKNVSKRCQSIIKMEVLHMGHVSFNPFLHE